ncbi:MAG TPA: hypothetical protein VK763_13075 [Terriglobales bacterium]|nr:hypothetical protein [Terriglobales bacterium]
MGTTKQMIKPGWAKEPAKTWRSRKPAKQAPAAKPTLETLVIPNRFNGEKSALPARL